MSYAEYVKLLTEFIRPKIIQTLTTYIFKTYPGLSYPILKQITEMVINKLITLSLEKTELLIYFKHIDLRISQQGKDFYNAALANSNAQRTGTDEEKEKAKQALINSFNEFIVIK